MFLDMCQHHELWSHPANLYISSNINHPHKVIIINIMPTVYLCVLPAPAGSKVKKVVTISMIIISEFSLARPAQIGHTADIAIYCLYLPMIHQGPSRVNT